MKRESSKKRVSMRKELYFLQQGQCPYCKQSISPDKASLDHIIPVDKMDGLSHKENLIMCCKKCNRNKGNHIVFSLLLDRNIYPMVDVEAFFRVNEIINHTKIRKSY